jgi:hypothetical protein
MVDQTATGFWQFSSAIRTNLKRIRRATRHSIQAATACTLRIG